MARDALEQGEGGMPLVDVPGGGLPPEGVDDPGAAHPQDYLLAEAHLPAPHVEDVGDGPVGGVVGGQVGVQQQQGHPAHVDAPDSDIDHPPRQFHLHDQGMTGAVEHPAQGPAGDLHRAVVVLLGALGVHLLVEVAQAVEEADGHHRHAQVGGRLGVVSGEHPQAAGVEGQRVVHAELGAQVGQAVGQGIGVVAGVPGVLGRQVVVEGGDDLVVEVGEGVVVLQVLPHLTGARLEHAERVEGVLPVGEADPLPELGGTVPDPPHVVGQVPETLIGLGDGHLCAGGHRDGRKGGGARDHKPWIGAGATAYPAGPPQRNRTPP